MIRELNRRIEVRSKKCRCIEIEILIQISIHPFEARIVHKVQVYKSKVVVIQWWISHLGQTIKQSNNQMIKWYFWRCKMLLLKKESTFFCSLKKKFEICWARSAVVANKRSAHVWLSRFLSPIYPDFILVKYG